MLEKEETEDGRERLSQLLSRVEENKWKYCKKSKDEIREDFYVNGVPVEYKHVDRKTGEVTSEVIRYKMLYRNASKAKVGLCNFINEKLYDEAYDWLTMGLGSKLPHEKAKIVEISAYAPLTTSTVEDRMHIPIEDVLILPDQSSFFHTVAEIITAEDYDSTERVVDEEKTARSRERAIKSGKLDIYGNPVYRTTYKQVLCKKKRCVVTRQETDVKNEMWDGMALIESDIMPVWCNGMVLLRNHFFKACAFRTYIQKFLRDYAVEHGIDYDTWELEDMFGVKHLARDVKLITTNNAIKWLKFIDLMGGTKSAAYEYWCDRVRADGCIWGCVKTDHPSKLSHLGQVQQMSYQMINTLPCTEEDVYELAKPSIEYVEKLKRDNDEFERFLRKNATAVNTYEMLADLYKWNHGFANSQLWRKEKRRIISEYVFRLRKGKIFIPGDNLTVCGNPYALLLHTVGEDWREDPTLRPESGVIQCYAPMFEDGEYLCGIRNPHNSGNNLGYFKNVKHPLMDKYFKFSKNIMAVNCIESDVQARMNGEDFDSDFNFVTNQPQMVAAAKRCYEEFPTVVNEIPESGITYTNDLHQYARMDSKMQQAQKAIGGSSDSAQLAQSYYWDKVAKGIDDAEKRELYENIIILAVIAQVSIDGCKKEYAVDPTVEIARIRSMSCMKRKADYPLFMKYTREITTTKNGKERSRKDVKADKDRLEKRIDKDIVCPMNWLQSALDKIQGNVRGNSGVIDTRDFFVHMIGKANQYQLSTVRKIVEEYDRYVQYHQFETEEQIEDLIIKTEIMLVKMKEIKINNILVINRLIATALGIEGKTHTNHRARNASKHAKQMLNILYRYDKEKFLINFIRE